MKLEDVIFSFVELSASEREKLRALNSLIVDFSPAYELSDKVSEASRLLKSGTYGKHVVIVDADQAPYACKHMVPNNIVKYNRATCTIDSICRQVTWILNGFKPASSRTEDSRTWFISDTHFFHKNIIDYCNRPWNSDDRDKDVLEMNEAIIDNWNKVVDKEDIVWHLGDFAMGKDKLQHVPELVSRLNGKINLVLGNHDKLDFKFYYEAGFNRVYDNPVLLKDFIVLSHEPMTFVKQPFFNVFGHVHDCATYKTFSEDSCCVCVERHGYAPISLQQIIDETKKLRKDN